ncbi:ABC transporter permease [Nocardioides szechwanensis]|uniref:Osmoprotectant transport system permease protein n=1 Tax=Nocardioides szechwanensis TaxID=1005944 RepID=A0A1H0H007_9ACTN|nr:ABC transporter permease [Nocardioides szechwanensis]GEP34127.1 ABC transporter permease [Nocardioides szechwanensis]SDO12465.1 osmoprotectant transport system permease protein [Nocardioides szechwanensis]
MSTLTSPDVGRRTTGRRGAVARVLAAPLVVAVLGLVTLLWLQSIELDSIEKRTLNTDYLVDRVREHLLLSLSAAALVALLAIPAGVLIHRTNSRVLRGVVLALANIGQATPAVGVVILLAIVWRTGFTTALVALVAYSFLPVLRNTLTGLAEVDPATREAARGMGMTRTQVLRRIELPLASPVILAGLRTSLVFAVGVATIATFINAGGLGDMIVNGLKLQRYPVLIVGAALVAGIAILIDWVAGLVEEYARPRGL